MRADVDAARRLVQEEDPGLGEEAAGELRVNMSTNVNPSRV